MLEVKLNKPFWERGDFPNVVQNGSESIILENPWVNGTKAALFDQCAYFFISSYATSPLLRWRGALRFTSPLVFFC
jgi:hypothetical protein